MHSFQLHHVMSSAWLLVHGMLKYWLQTVTPPRASWMQGTHCRAWGISCSMTDHEQCFCQHHPSSSDRASYHTWQLRLSAWVQPLPA